MMPHMHLRGKDMTYHLIYPDGRDEIILSVPKTNSIRIPTGRCIAGE